MNKVRVEKALKTKKEELQMTEVPSELEERLRSALKQRPRNRSNNNRKGLIAAVLVFTLIFTYSYDTLAYYGKKIMGYDDVVYGSLKDLNEEGAGQEINDSYTFPNGVEVTLNGIMFDENELVAFYKVQNNGTKWEDINILYRLQGIKPLGYSAKGGHGVQINEDTQVWVHSFESPSFFEKWMAFEMQMVVPGESIIGTIEFELNRDKAMKRVVKQELDEQVQIEELLISFKSLTASRLSTVVEGTIQVSSEAEPDILSRMFDRVGHRRLKFDIIVDGKKYDTAYSGMSTSGGKVSFTSETMGLPVDFNQIELANIRLVKTDMIAEEVMITPDMRDTRITEDLVIKEVTQEGDNTEITILSRGTPVMGLFIDGKQVKNLNTEQYRDLPESDVPAAKTYSFRGQGDKMQLAVKGINYTQQSNHNINIPMK